MSNREDLNNIDHDLGKLHTYVAEYIKQVIGGSYIGHQQFKGTLDRVLIPYSDTQLEFIKGNFANEVREPMQAYWILKILGQRNAPENEELQDELNILNQLLYKPGRIVPGLNQDNIISNGYDFTSLVALLTKIKLIRYLVENHTVIKNYIDNNKDTIDRNYPELNTQTIDWLKGEFTKIRDIAIKPSDHVTSTYGRAPAPNKALPALKISVPADARPAPVLPRPIPEPSVPSRAPYVAPYVPPSVPPRAPYVAPYVPPYVPPRAPYVPPRGGYYVPPPPRLSNWQSFLQADRNTSWFDRFSFSRLFNNDGVFDVTPQAGFISSIFYNLIFWSNLSLSVRLTKDIFVNALTTIADVIRYPFGRGRFTDVVEHAVNLSMALGMLLVSPLLVVAPLLLALTSLPILAVGKGLSALPLPSLVSGIISKLTDVVDAAKDTFIIGTSLYFLSNYLGSFAFGPQLLAKLGLATFLPPLSTPFFALSLAVTATFIVIPIASTLLLTTARTLVNLVGPGFKGMASLLRFNHAPEREVVHASERGARLGDYLAHRPAHRMDADDAPARELRLGQRGIPRRDEDNADNARPVRRFRVR